MSENKIAAPPLVPQDEIVLPDDEKLNDFWLASIAEREEKNWKFGTPLLTSSDEWGLVWRVDFALPNDSSSSLVNRIVCWRNADGRIVQQFAFGQKIPKLR